MLAEHGLHISAGKMSGWWSGNPTGIKFVELDVICAALDCTVTDRMAAEPENAPRLADTSDEAIVGSVHAITPRPRPGGRSLPPR